MASKRTYRLYLASQALLLGGAIAGAVLSSHTIDWGPLPLLALLATLAVLAEWFTIEIGSMTLSAGEFGLVLAMVLLGPAPAVAIGLLAASVDALRRRPSLAAAANNLATYASSLLIGSLLSLALVGDAHLASHVSITSLTFGLAVFAVSVASYVLNFALVMTLPVFLEREKLATLVRTMLVPTTLLPTLLAGGILTGALALAYTTLSYPALLAGVFTILLVQYLAGALIRSEERAEQLRARSLNLASLQLGVLVTLVETLALRDRPAAKHAAAVARYAHALAGELGCDESERDLVHTAGLLHDIGKFALPDRILQSRLLSDEDWRTVRRHPQDGATLVGRLDGYGPVAEIILYHHEHVDGSGYPAGLIGNEIPLLARMLAICNVYDTLTARDSYRQAMTPQDAIAELRREAGHSLDEELTQRFVALLEREGPLAFTQEAETSFESELAFERRARALAAPTST
ncbi:MAG: HD-GYP domain-containing protein [Solirubrobacteraceae bacterium]